MGDDTGKRIWNLRHGDSAAVDELSQFSANILNDYADEAARRAVCAQERSPGTQMKH